MSENKKWSPKDDEAEEVEEEDVQYQSLKDATLFAIHVSDSMLSHSEEDDSGSTVQTALECAYAVLQSRIISNPSDMMGILLFGTEQTKFQEDFPHCYLLMDLEVPDAKSIKGLKKLIEDPEEFDKLMVPTKEPLFMASLLFCANQIFTTKAPNFQSKRLFIVTDDDNPHADNKDHKTSAITRARDLYDLGISIDPFCISNPGKEVFDLSKFYDDIVYRSPHDDDEDQIFTSVNGSTRLKEMVSTIKSKITAKRALFTCKLEIGPGLAVGVKGYAIYKRQEKGRSHYVYTGGEKAQIVQSSTAIMAESTAKVVGKAEIRKAYKFGGEQIMFTPEEMKELRNFGETVIRIIGFKPADFLPFDYNIKPAQFIYPDEAEIIGSTRTFAALHKKLVQSGKIGIAWAVVRGNAAPVLMALVPSEEIIEGRVQVQPPGLFMIALPFADDIRQNPEVPLVEVPEILIDKMRAVLKQLHMPKGYNPHKYSNPSLQWHYRILQAVALDEDVPDQPVDTTLPKYKLIHKHAGKYVLEWGGELAKHCQTTRVDDDARSSKKIKSAVKIEGGDEVRAAYQNGSLGKLTVATLKPWMKTVGLESSGKKADLIVRIEDYLNTK
ncbi:ATP-dependent DNA helicase II subunit 1 [Rhizina undulata]